jgi:predicted RND superfamily exporter protein
MHRKRNALLIGYGFLSLVSIFLLTRLQFSFDFEQFFPQGDPDYAFFKDFTQDFESDDNFLLVAIDRTEGVFDSAFLSDVHDLTLKTADLPFVTASMSLTKARYPLKTPFGITTVPAIHIDQPEFYDADKARILQDRRFVHNLIAEDATAINLVIKTVNQNTLQQAESLMAGLDSLVNSYTFEQVHMLGRPFFQRDLVWMEKREILVSTVVAALLACAVLFFIYRRMLLVLIAMMGIALSLLFFLATLSLFGRELNALSALYPILMCIVGVADTIHLTTKYLDELAKGQTRQTAIRITLRAVGLATFITCATTALGFASLITSRTLPIQGFGINAAIGVVVAFFTIYGWLWAVLPRFSSEQLFKHSREYAFWDRFMEWTYGVTRRRKALIIGVSLGLLALCLWGISMIHTNYHIKSNLPRGQKITEDFLYFEQKFAGFRPIEIAVMPQGGRLADDYEVLREVDKLESHLRTYPPIKTTSSINDLYRSLRAMHFGNQPNAYQFPENRDMFEQYQILANKAPASATEVLINNSRTKTRIASRITDIGRDSVTGIQKSIENWFETHTNPDVVQFKVTGTGLILDKNAEYIRDSMLKGLIPSILIVAGIMGFLFRDPKIMLVFIVPNVFPLFFAGALIGFVGIPLEAGIATVFSIVFGIATDDTIHFLSAFKIAKKQGLSVEQALHTTLMETGKAMTLSSIILFFSFLVMLFSIHPPSLTVGMLVSVTLAGALFCDLLLAPILVRWLIKDPAQPADVDLQSATFSL